MWCRILRQHASRNSHTFHKMANHVPDLQKLETIQIIDFKGHHFLTLEDF